MVFFESLKIGAEVEFLKNEKVCCGIVRYKGGVVNREGDWVGVETEEQG